jgi:FAD/FMN-containing dehydrogenase
VARPLTPFHHYLHEVEELARKRLDEREKGALRQMLDRKTGDRYKSMKLAWQYEEPHQMAADTLVFIAKQRAKTLANPTPTGESLRRLVDRMHRIADERSGRVTLPPGSSRG